MMMFPFFHLALNHFPVIGISVVTILLGVAIFFKNNFVAKVSLWLIIFFALMTVGVFWTGMNSVAFVSTFSNVSTEFIGKHIQMAYRACITMGVLAGTALLGIVLFREKNEVPRYFSLFVFIMSLVGAFFFARTNEVGSLIAHPELRASGVQVSNSADFQKQNPVTFDGIGS